MKRLHKISRAKDVPMCYNTARKRGAMEADKRTILIAGMGTSPAVLTETVWALCHQHKPTVPDEIVVLRVQYNVGGREML